jgi:hypothetical protein
MVVLTALEELSKQLSTALTYHYSVKGVDTSDFLRGRIYQLHEFLALKETLKNLIEMAKEQEAEKGKGN